MADGDDWEAEMNSDDAVDSGGTGELATERNRTGSQNESDQFEPEVNSRNKRRRDSSNPDDSPEPSPVMKHYLLPSPSLDNPNKVLYNKI